MFNKKYLKTSSLSIFITLILIFTGCSPSQLDNKSNEVQPVQNITILYTNDEHAQVKPKEFKDSDGKEIIKGGFAELTTLVNQYREDSENVFFFSAGDNMTGPAVSKLTKGEAIFDLFNYMKYDAMAIGNHEFDHGWPNLLQVMSKAEFPVLACNIFYEGTDKLYGQPYAIVEKGDVKIGVIGVLGKFAAYDTIASKWIEGLEFREQAPIIQHYVDELNSEVDLIVVLAHQGKPGIQSSSAEYDTQRDLGKDLEVANEVKGIDILITGHAHRVLEEPVIAEETGTIIVTSPGITQALGYLEIEYDRTSDKILSYDGYLIDVNSAEINPDKIVTERINYWDKQIDKITSEIIGYTEVPLTRNYNGESVAGNLVSDAIRIEAHSDIGFYNGGGLRADIDKGDVTIGEVLALMPFDNQIIKSDITAKNLLNVLEFSVSQVKDGKLIQVCQVSGIKFNYDITKEIGKRVSNVFVDGETLDMNKTYTMATSDFQHYGGSGYSMLTDNENAFDIGTRVDEAIVKFISKEKIIHPVLEDRIAPLN